MYSVVLAEEVPGRRPKKEEKREQAPALHMELSIAISIAQDRVKSRKTLRKLWRFDAA
jgi:hypothetical protein